MRLLKTLLPPLALLSGAAATISGCSGGPAIDHNAFQQQIVHAVCDTVQNCCMAAERGFNSTNCLNKIAAAFTVPLSDTSLYYDSARAGQCVQQLTAQAQACQSVDYTPCYDAFVGNVPPGGACAQSFECAQGPDRFAVCSNGVCVQPPRGVFGQPCSYSCIDTAGMAHCQSPGAIAAGDGVACHSINGLVCVQPLNGMATCQPASADCRENPNGACQPGQTCDMTTGQCYVPTPIGGNCMQVPCAPGGYCAGSLCYPQKGIAVNCSQDSECLSGKCEKGLCVVYSQAAKDWCGDSTAGQ
jgi:hypothetical protein